MEHLEVKRAIISGSLKKASLPIPHFDGRYVINRNGSIFDTVLMEEVKPSVEDGVNVVSLGGVTYPAVNLIGATFKNMKLTLSQIRQLEFYFLDGNTDNMTPDNLVVKCFPDIDEFKFVVNGKTFKVVPGYTRYGISECGAFAMVGSDDYKVKTTTVAATASESFYVTLPVPSDLGVTSRTTRHRLMALAYKPYPKDVDLLIVNHIDQIKGHDVLDNLEWVTPQYNAVHGASNGQHIQAIEYEAKCVITGTVTRKPTLSQLARHLGINPNQLWSIDRRKAAGYDHPITLPHHMFRPVSEDPWPDISGINLLDTRMAAYRVYDETTGETHFFKSGSRLQRCLSVTEKTVRRYRDTGEVYNGYTIERFIPRYDVKYDWCDGTSKQFRAGKKEVTGCRVEVEVRRLRDGYVKTYATLSDASRDLNRDLTSLRNSIKTNHIIRGGYLVRYKGEVGEWVIPDYTLKDLPNIARVAKIADDGSEIRRYNSLMDAHRDLSTNISYGTLLNSMKFDGLSSLKFDNYYFKFVLD